ncbi:hypothetical protein MUA41_00845 [Staphylococcus simulans]|uniref:hypothetical protein n=1 Tax=Staphylococcus simulans TaxID=1286 RepID=UPI0021D0066B|nr:hypothetical protein [Staphylococcus simulans]UXR38046.1 hypothetical protein MUA41_00845 [Staphylococcus simulans]
MKKQLADNPKLISEAMEFANVAAQYQLVSSQALDGVAQNVNKIAGTNWNFEGSKQAARDIQVFNQMKVDPFKNSGVFNNPETLQTYLNYGGENIEKNLQRKLTGTAQEIDWLRDRKGSLTRIYEKTKLVGGETANAPGIDGITQNRFTGVTKGVSVKNSVSNKGLGTNVSDVLKALQKGTLKPDDIVVGTDGTKQSVAKMIENNIAKATQEGNTELLNKLNVAKEKLKVQEIGNFDKAKASSERLMDKAKKGRAVTTITAKEVGKQVRNGAVIGAVVGCSLSTITNYVKYKNGEISKEEAFTNVGLDTASSATIGGVMAGVSLFFPPGALGVVAGIAIGMYVSAVTKNVLSEIFGKGAFEQILHSSGFIYGNAINLGNLLEKIIQNEKKINENHQRIIALHKSTDQKRRNIDKLMEDF